MQRGHLYARGRGSGAPILQLKEGLHPGRRTGGPAGQDLGGRADRSAGLSVAWRTPPKPICRSFPRKRAARRRRGLRRRRGDARASLRQPDCGSLRGDPGSVCGRRSAPLPLPEPGPAPARHRVARRLGSGRAAGDPPSRADDRALRLAAPGDRALGPRQPDRTGRVASRSGPTTTSPKPVYLPELAARIRSVLRRRGEAPLRPDPESATWRLIRRGAR